MAFDATIPVPSVYVTEMAKPLVDKMFFADKVDADVFVDFGCANGVLLTALKTLFPAHVYIGFDESESMIEEAVRGSSPDIVFTSNWDRVLALVERHHVDGHKTCLILSSIIHEAQAYLTPAELRAFWDRVWNSGFDYIAIRDMMVSRTTSRASDPVSVACVRQMYDPTRLTQWEETWGSIDENWSLVHFLLTYRYTDNWEREVRENYLPVPFEVFLRSIPSSYKPSYIEHFTLPFLRSQIRRDFEIDLQDRTHLKLILERDTL